MTFGMWLVLFFVVSWTLSLVALYMLLPALRNLIPIAAFALLASTFLISMCVTVAFLLLKTSFPNPHEGGENHQRFIHLNPFGFFRN